MSWRGSTSAATCVNLNFEAGKNYKIRIISMAAFASIFLTFGEEHEMKIIEVDGSYIEPSEPLKFALRRRRDIKSS